MNEAALTSNSINAPNLVGAQIENFVSKSTTPSAKGGQTISEIQAVGKQFEGVFLSMLLKEMRNTLGEGGFFGEESSDTYGGMFDLFVGESLAESKPLGISDLLLANYSKNQTNGDVPGAAQAVDTASFSGVF